MDGGTGWDNKKMDGIKKKKKDLDATRSSSSSSRKSSNSTEGQRTSAGGAAPPNNNNNNATLGFLALVKTGLKEDYPKFVKALQTLKGMKLCINRGDLVTSAALHDWIAGVKQIFHSPERLTLAEQFKHFVPFESNLREMYVQSVMGPLSSMTTGSSNTDWGVEASISAGAAASSSSKISEKTVERNANTAPDAASAAMDTKVFF